MTNLTRRSLLKYFGTATTFMALPACGPRDEAKALGVRPVSSPPPAPVVTPANVPAADGYLAIVQGPTSQTETLINVLAPRLKKYVYSVTDSNGVAVQVETYETVKSPTFYSVDKLKISGLSVGVEYTLRVHDRTTLIDERVFRALDTSKSEPNFALLSCMSDDRVFEKIIDPMWKKLQEQDVDFLVLSGDQVYVDSFEFVERQKATEFDLWQRYVDALKRLPLYHWRTLKPVFAVWDDHDFGTNDGDRDFVSKEQALRLFNAVFGGPALSGTWERGPYGCSSVFTGFGQRFFLMDDRTFRQPNKNQQAADPYGHWGREQHEWLIAQLKSGSSPAWIVNGNQFFNGVTLSFKEAFEQNHPAEFVTFVEELKSLPVPVVFASGDVHLSEIMRVPAERLGYETFEITSSCMHSFMGSGWENPMRLAGAYVLQHNFMTIRSKSATGSLKISAKSMGLAAQSYFERDIEITR